MRDRADHRDLVHHPRQLRQPLADVQARHARRDRTQLAADLHRGVGLGVERLELAGRAVQEEQDARLRLAETRQAVAEASRRRRPAPTRPHSGRPSPSSPSEPTWSRSRRVRPSQSRFGPPRTRSIEVLPRRSDELSNNSRTLAQRTRKPVGDQSVVWKPDQPAGHAGATDRASRYD